MNEKKNEIILFENQGVKLEVNLKDETVWLNREQLAELFDRDVKTIGKHINNALKEELSDDTLVVAKFYYNIENKYYELEESINTNKQMSLKSVIWNSEIPLPEQLSACDNYLSSGYNSLTKKHCEIIIEDYQEKKNVLY